MIEDKNQNNEQSATEVSQHYEEPFFRWSQFQTTTVLQPKESENNEPAVKLLALAKIMNQRNARESKMYGVALGNVKERLGQLSRKEEELAAKQVALEAKMVELKASYEKQLKRKDDQIGELKTGLTDALQEKEKYIGLHLDLDQAHKQMRIKQQNYIKVIQRLEGEVFEAKNLLEEKQADISRLIASTRVQQLQKLLEQSNKQIERITANLENMETPNRKKSLDEFSQQSQNNRPMGNQLSNELVQAFHQTRQLSNSSSSSSDSHSQPQPQPGLEQERQSVSYGSKDKQEDILEVELEILKCKYKLLEKMYLELKHQSEGEDSEERRSVGVQTEDRDEDILGDSLKGDVEEDNGKSLSEAQRPLKKTLSGYNLHQEQPNKLLDISIADSLKNPHKTSTLHSPTPSLLSLNQNLASLFTPSSLQTKIKNFNYQTSILHKISTSKFITSPVSKVAFVFQYACLLEMYFSGEFLRGVLQGLVMGDRVDVGRIGVGELNRELVDLDKREDRKEEGSFLSQASSRSKFNLAKQFSINNLSGIEQPKPRKTNLELSPKQFSQNLSQTPANLAQLPQNLPSLESQLNSLSKFLSSQNLDLANPSSKPILAQKLHRLIDNEIAQLLLKLINENEAMKVCLNVMIKNQEMLTKTSNDVYFQSVEAEEKKEKGMGQGQEKGEAKVGKENCSVM